MSYKETLNSGLKRGFEVVLETEDLNKNINVKVEEVKKTIKIDGFRPGKVPTNIIMQKHGDAINAEVLNKMVNDNVSQIIQENKYRPVSQPKVDLKDKEKEGKQVFNVEFELFPEIKLADFSKIVIESSKVKLEKAEVDKRLDLIAKNQRTYKEEKDDYKSKNEDSVLLDYEGTIDGKNFDGGKAEDQTIVIGSGQYLKDLEEGLIGVKKGDNKKIKVKFPENYGQKDLQNAEAVFECNIKKISIPQESKVNDEFAKSVGATDLRDLKTKVEAQMLKEYSDLSKSLDKKNLFEKLQESHKFELPENLVETEFNGLKEKHLQSEQAVSDAHKKEIKDKKLSSENEKRFKEDANSRIQLGLILQEIGKTNAIQVTGDEMNKALYEYAGNFRGQEQKVIDYYKNNQEAAMQFQAPLYENKIVDFILSKVKLKTKELDVDSFIKIYNNVDSNLEKPKTKKTTKKKTTKKKTTKKKTASKKK
tara:strand:- start:382 stop:1812 length:1431 start_codon:yes stop_codon:yes gene_type:complete